MNAAVLTARQGDGFLGSKSRETPSDPMRASYPMRGTGVRREVGALATPDSVASKSNREGFEGSFKSYHWPSVQEQPDINWTEENAERLKRLYRALQQGRFSEQWETEFPAAKENESV